VTRSETKPRRKWKLILPLAVLGACVESCVLFFAYNLARDMVAQSAFVQKPASLLARTELASA